MTRYFADTYALVEMGKGAPQYKPYISADFVLTKWNLAEFYYSLIREGKPAMTQFNEFRKRLISISFTSIIAAAQFKLRHKEKRMSYVDCVGYALALEHGMKFLTGDKQFKGMPNVEWVA